jgi:hypothetical protein
MRAKMNLETDQLEVGNDRFPLRRTTVDGTRFDRSPGNAASAVAIGAEPETKEGWPEQKYSLNGGKPQASSSMPKKGLKGAEGQSDK